MGIKDLRVLLKELEAARPAGRYPPPGYRRVRRGFFRHGRPVWILERAPELLGVPEFIHKHREQGFSWNQIARHLQAHGIKSPSGNEWTANSVKGLYRRWKNKVPPLDYVI